MILDFGIEMNISWKFRQINQYVDKKIHRIFPHEVHWKNIQSTFDYAKKGN